MIAENILNIKDSVLRLILLKASGVFFICNKKNYVLNPHYCREIFAHTLQRLNIKVGFSCNNLKIDLLDKFFTHIEKKLKLEKHTTFYNTNLKDTVVLEPSPFWLSNTTRKEFFTLFLRCGAIYYPKCQDFNKVMKRYSLMDRILPVIKHFLAGNTLPTYKYFPSDFGIVETFAPDGKNPIFADDFKTRLIKPVNKPISKL